MRKKRGGERMNDNDLEPGLTFVAIKNCIQTFLVSLSPILSLVPSFLSLSFFLFLNFLRERETERERERRESNMWSIEWILK